MESGAVQVERRGRGRPRKVKKVEMDVEKDAVKEVEKDAVKEVEKDAVKEVEKDAVKEVEKDAVKEVEVVQVERRGRGRPKKVKKDVVMEIEAGGVPVVVEKRGRGRGRKRKIQDVEDVGVDGLNRKTRAKALVGSYVNKEFEGSYYLGKVVSYDRGFYRVEYEDGDSEDFESSELRPFLIENDSCDDKLVLRKKELDGMIMKKYEKERADKMRDADAVGGVKDSSLGEVMDHGTNGVIDDVDCSSDSGEYGLDGDLCVAAEECIVPPPQLPPSTGNIGVPDECVTDLLSVYSFLRSFSVSLFLSPFGLEDFVGSLNCSVQNTLLDAIHVSLMCVLRRHFEAPSSDGSALSAMDWTLMDSLTWPVFIAEYLMLKGHTEGPEWKGFYVDALQKEYYTLSVSRKLIILQILCDDVLDSAELRTEIDMREESEMQEELEVEVDRDGDTIATHVGPRRVHPRFSKTSACKDQEATEYMQERGDVKLSSNSSSFGYKNTGPDAAADGEQDANSDECRLCGMDGTLLCCDGCPSAYHSRCIGVSKMCIPKGDWYCPECTINKISPTITGRTSLRGAECFGVDPYEQVFLGACDHLLVINMSMNTESSVKYYHKEDIPSVLLALCSEAQHLDLYSGLCERIMKCWEIPANIIPIADKVETGLSSAKIEDGACPTTEFSGANRNSHEICETYVSEDIASCIAEGSYENIAGPFIGNTTKEHERSKASLNMRIETDHPLQYLCNSESIEEPDRPFQIAKLSEQIKVTTTISSGSVSHQGDLSDTTQLKLVGWSGQRGNAMCTAGNNNSFNRGQSNCPASIKSCRNIGDGCFYLGSSFKAQAYMNHYIHGDFAASASANLAKLSSEEIPVSEPKTSYNYKKVMSANITLQTKAFSSAVNRFFWPNSEKKLMEVPRERCSWCLSCKAICQSKRGCLLNAAASNAIKGTMKILSGIRPVKQGQGSIPSIATYLLLMEESLHGLTAGPFKTLDYRKKWCKQAEQASTCSAVKSLLLELEENIHHVAFSGDWVKLVDGWSVESSATHGSSAAESSQKYGPGGWRGRKPSAVPEVRVDGDVDIAGDFIWWRGGILSKYMFQKGILPQNLVKKSARQGGSRKISGIYYADGVEAPKRSRRFIWRAAVEMSRNASQLSTQVRYLDIHVRWSDLVRPDQSSIDGKGAETEAYVFRNASICDKQILESKVRYAVAFGNQKHLPSRIMKNVTEVEKNEDGTVKYWFLEAHIPLYVVKEYEEKIEKVPSPLAEKPMSVLSKLQKQQLKVSRKDIFYYLTQKRDNLESCRCASCHLDVFLGNAVKCSKCEGYCHLQCTFRSTVHMSVEVDLVMTCKSCYRTEATTQNEKYPTSPLLLQREKPLNAATAQKGKKQNGIHSPLASNGALPHSVGRKPASNVKSKNKGKECSWGLVKKKNCEDVPYFRLQNILLKGYSNSSGVECDICKKPYDFNLTYICCETCTKWYHADAVELEESKILEVIGFKCCKCRRWRSPACPYADPEEKNASEGKKPNRRALKQASQVTGSCRETISEHLTLGESATHVLPIKKGLVCIKGDNPLTFSLARVNNSTQQTSAVALEQNPTLSASVPQKLPVRRHVKKDDDVVGSSTNNTSVDSPKPIAGNTFLPAEESAPGLEWDVSTNVEDDFMFDIEDLNYYEDAEFEPQTYFSFNELFDDSAQVDGVDPSGNIIANIDNSLVIPEDANLEQYGMVIDQQEHLDSSEPSFQIMPCRTCFFTDPIPDSVCQICGSWMHTQCSQWVVDSSNNGAWRCGNCRDRQ